MFSSEKPTQLDMIGDCGIQLGLVQAIASFYEVLTEAHNDRQPNT